MSVANLASAVNDDLNAVSILASIAAAIAVGRIGNKPVTASEILTILDDL